MEVDEAAHKPQSSGKKNKTVRLPLDIQEEIDCLYEFVPEVEEHFEVIDKIGEGTFSCVFLARLKHYREIGQLFALKHIIPTSHPSRIEGELRCLLEIGGCDNVMGVELCIRNRDHVVIVMQYFPHEKFQDYVLQMSLQDVHDYIKNLLIALRRVHKFDIIHRDVKPSNFLCDRKTNRYALVDFGLAHKAPVCRRIGGDVLESCTSTPVTTGARKCVLTQSQVDTNSTAVTSPNHISKSNPSSHFKSREYTPDLSNCVFSKRVKSPRRLLLAKRALLAKEKQDSILSQRKSSRQQYLPTACQCYARPQICSLCSSRGNQTAPRAGTPGFRSPEVLIKCPDQSTSVDIWSAGVIFLSLLSGRYPFFRANDDLTALAQIISTFGSEAVKNAAKACGKTMICNPNQTKLDLRSMCMKLRTAPLNKQASCKQYKMDSEAEASWRHVPDTAFHLLSQLLDLNPFTRITAEEALRHPFFTEQESSR